MLGMNFPSTVPADLATRLAAHAARLGAAAPAELFADATGSHALVAPAAKRYVPSGIGVFLLGLRGIDWIWQDATFDVLLELWLGVVSEGFSGHG